MGGSLRPKSKSDVPQVSSTQHRAWHKGGLRKTLLNKWVNEWMPRMHFIIWFPPLVNSYINIKTWLKCPFPDSGKQPVALSSDRIAPRCFPVTASHLWTVNVQDLGVSPAVCFQLGPGTQEALGDLCWINERVKAVGKIITRKPNLLVGVRKSS